MILRESRHTLAKKAARCIVSMLPTRERHSMWILCQWINKNKLPNETLEPGTPRKIAMETTTKWMHEMGFVVLTAKKES